MPLAEEQKCLRCSGAGTRAAVSIDGKAVADALRSGKLHTVPDRISLGEERDIAGVKAFLWPVWDGPPASGARLMRAETPGREAIIALAGG